MDCNLPKGWGKHMSVMPTKGWVVLAVVSLMNVAHAQEPAGSGVQLAHHHGVGAHPTHSQVYSPAATPGVYPPGGQYPQLHAPLYPSPVQNPSTWQSGTIITNQAFAPHEMLYPHTYRAMYPPFYHKVSGGWFWTPFGFRQHENWKLQGTEVTVKYRSHYPVFGGFHPPRVK
ncbi:MAG TPA: hypothetical protein VNQ76_15450 [Planctomicrobium sp.]|nr:hypothetical protein [Planctomicrobium sp.]